MQSGWSPPRCTSNDTNTTTAAPRFSSTNGTPPPAHTTDSLEAVPIGTYYMLGQHLQGNLMNDGGTNDQHSDHLDYQVPGVPEHFPMAPTAVIDSSLAQGGLWSLPPLLQATNAQNQNTVPTGLQQPESSKWRGLKRSSSPTSYSSTDCSPTRHEHGMLESQKTGKKSPTSNDSYWANLLPPEPQCASAEVEGKVDIVLPPASPDSPFRNQFGQTSESSAAKRHVAFNSPLRTSQPPLSSDRHDPPQCGPFQLRGENIQEATRSIAFDASPRAPQPPFVSSCQNPAPYRPLQNCDEEDQAFKKPFVFGSPSWGPPILSSNRRFQLSDAAKKEFVFNTSPTTPEQPFSPIRHDPRRYGLVKPNRKAVEAVKRRLTFDSPPLTPQPPCLYISHNEYSDSTSKTTSQSSFTPVPQSQSSFSSVPDQAYCLPSRVKLQSTSSPSSSARVCQQSQQPPRAGQQFLSPSRVSPECPSSPRAVQQPRSSPGSPQQSPNHEDQLQL